MDRTRGREGQFRIERVDGDEGDGREKQKRTSVDELLRLVRPIEDDSERLCNDESREDFSFRFELFSLRTFDRLHPT